jgi:hypothetical protein
MVRARARQASFTIRTVAVPSQRTAQLTVTAASGVRAALLTLNPPTVQRVKLKSARLRGGAATVATVLLDGPAPAGGLALTVAADQGAVEAPPTVLVAAGKSSVKFNVRTAAVSTTVVAGISVSVSGAPAAARLTILPSRAVRKSRSAGAPKSRPLAALIRPN